MSEQLFTNNFGSTVLLSISVILVLLATVTLVYGLGTLIIDGDIIISAVTLTIAIISIGCACVTIWPNHKQTDDIKTIKKVTSKTITNSQLTVCQNQRSSRKESAYGKFQ